QPGPAGLLSAWSSTWAWVRVRAAIFPLRTSASNCSRSSGLKVTTYFFMLGVLRGLVTAMFPKNTQRLLTLNITPDEVLGRSGARSPGELRNVVLVRPTAKGWVQAIIPAREPFSFVSSSFAGSLLP